MKELWQHQKDARVKAKERQNLALLFKPGRGKTRTMIEILRDEYNNRKNISRTLVMAPLSTCHQWKNQFSQYSKIPEDKIHVLTGSGKSRLKALAEIQTGIIITNYEAVQIQGLYEALDSWHPQITIFDESQRLKNPSGIRSKKCYKLSQKARRRFILTGTLVTQSLLDVFGQWRCIKPEVFGYNFFVFRSRFFFDKNAGMPSYCHFPDWQPIPGAAEKIAALIAEDSAQATDYPDLPPLLRIEQPVELGVDQYKAYTEMKEQFLTELKGIVSIAEFAMTKTMRLRQIIAGFLTSEDGANVKWFDDVPRLNAVAEILESLGDERLIIWTEFRPTYERLSFVCRETGKNHVFFTGEQSPEEKEASKLAFINGDAQILIGNPAAGGIGVDGLQIAKYALYYTQGYSLELRLQSEARNYRAGSEQHQNVTHYHLIAENTLDRVIADALAGKKDISESVLAWARKEEYVSNN